MVTRDGSRAETRAHERLGVSSLTPVRPGHDAAGASGDGVSGDAAPVGRDRSAWIRWTLVVGSIEALLVGVAASRWLYSDSFYNLVAGREIVRHGFSQTDPWTFLGANRRWIDQQWLAHVAYYGSSTLGGLRAVSILSALLIGAGVGVLAAIMASRGTAPLRVVVWVALVAVVAEANSIVRAQSFAYLAFAVSLALLLADWESPSRRRRLALVLTLLAWANLHGSVVAFVPVLALAWAWRAVRLWRASDRRAAVAQLGWIAAACIASMTTPFGLGIVGYYRSELDNPTLQQHISEWQAASVQNPFEILFFVALAATALACAYAIWRRVPLALPLALATVWYAYSGLVAKRSEVWFAFVAALVISEILTCRDARAGRSPSARVGRLGWRLAAPLTVAALATMTGVMAAGPALAYQGTPRRAIDLAATIGGPKAEICADNDTSTALEWRHPELRGRVAFDARFELYSAAQLRGIFSLIADPHPRAPAWFSRCDVFLVDRKGSDHPGFARLVRAMPGYRVVYDRRYEALVAVRTAR
jgi:hypothetical protein